MAESESDEGVQNSASDDVRREPSAPDFDPEMSITGIVYEYRMVIATAQILASGNERGTVIEVAVLESFLVHARNLHGFLRLPKSRRGRPGDYWACSFVDGFGVEVFDTATVQKINRWLQHITTWRYEDDQHPRWDSIAMFGALVDGMDQFLESWDHELASPLLSVHADAQQLRSTLRHTVGGREIRT